MKVLFISNSPSLSGAPLVLLNFLQWAKKNNKPLIPSLLFLKPGERQKDFESVTKNIYVLPVEEKLISVLQLIYERICIKLRIYRSPKDILLDKLTKDKYDIIYCNTVVTLRLGIEIKDIFLKNFPNHRVKIVCHLHELEIAIQHSEPRFTQLKNPVDGWIAVSDLVKKNLMVNHGIKDEKVDLVHAFVNPVDINALAVKKRTSFIIGASGYYYWAKGNDVFIQVADRFFKSFPGTDAVFVWVGFVHPVDRLVLDRDLKLMGLSEKVLFIGESKTALKEFSSFDVFLMTSREDSFPLVCLEVGALGKPIICFENAIGSEEFLKSGGGKIVPYLDVEAMKDAIYQYTENEELRKKDAEKIKELVLPFSTENQSPKIYALLEKLLNS